MRMTTTSSPPKQTRVCCASWPRYNLPLLDWRSIVSDIPKLLDECIPEVNVRPSPCMQAAYYLDIQPLVTLTSRVLASHISGKTASELRAAFGLSSNQVGYATRAALSSLVLLSFCVLPCHSLAPPSLQVPKQSTVTNPRAIACTASSPSAKPYPRRILNCRRLLLPWRWSPKPVGVLGARNANGW